MAKVSFKRRLTNKEVDNIPIEDGNLILTKEGGIFTDYDEKRVKIEGVPSGGTKGQVLTKKSDDDNDTEWTDQTGGSGGGGDSIPVGSIFDYDGTEVPSGYKKVENILYEDSEGVSTDFDLAKNPNEFDFLEFYGITSDNVPCYTKIEKINFGKRIVLSNFAVDGNLYFKLAVLSITDKTVTFKQNSEWYKSATAVTGGYVAKSTAIKIQKVVGGNL